jgi:cytochrome c biogenesis protein CcdA
MRRLVFMPPAARALFVKRALDPQKLLFGLCLVLSVVLGNGWVCADNGAFRVGPYLVDVSADSAVVAFHLFESMDARVVVFDGPQAREFRSLDKRRSHFVEATGLSPGVSYRYEVVCGDNTVRTPPGDSSYQIKTAGRPGEYFTFSVFGDPRPGDNLVNRHHEAVIERVLLQEPVFNLVLGDMVDDGADHKLWENFFHVEAELLRRSALLPVLGDNDYAGGEGKFAEYFPRLRKGFYRFYWGGVYFFALHAWDTKGSQPREEFDGSSAQFLWFEEEMARPEVKEAPFRVVFMHDPVYICRGRASEVLAQTWIPVFQRHRVDVVFASWHIYERSRDKGITYIISGGAGAELIWMNKNPSYPSQVDAQQYHFCRVDVGSNAMTIRGVSTDGTVLDTITLTPRGRDEEDVNQAASTAARLGKEMLMNKVNDGTPEIPLYLFSYDCNYCRKLLGQVLPSLARQNNIALRVFYYDLGREGTYDLFLNAGAEFGRQGSDIPAVFIGSSVLGGEGEIESRLPGQIKTFLENPRQFHADSIQPFKQTHDTRSMGEEAFDTLTLSIVLGAGLLDGINPCAFTTIIFLISYLSLVGASRKRMLYTGGTFTAAVFLTYFVIGLVFFNFARLLLREQGVAKIVNLVLLVLVGALAVFSFFDFVKCLKGKAADMSLQLPGFLKKGIHEKIRNFARHKVAMVGTSFVLGVVIAGMELTCTGQVYIPIVTMISEPRHRIMAISYLLAYNIAFIIPLAAVFLLVAFGLTSQKLGELFKRHIAGVKLGFAVLFVLMAIMIIYNLRWL